MSPWQKQNLQQHTSIVVVALFFAAIGIYFTWRILAAPIASALEIEKGTPTPPAKTVSDANASGGQAVQFITDTPPTTSAYNAKVLADNPVLFLPMTVAGVTEKDLAVGNHTATYKPGVPSKTTLPNGESAAVFNGSSQYLEVADANDLSVTNKGILTIEAWMRPDALNFTAPTDGYVHWMGKGAGNQQEYVSRIYKKDSGRPNRISGYVYNPYDITGTGSNQGAGSYFQDVLTAGQWIHYTLIIDTVHTSAGYTTGFIKIYKNGVARDQDNLTDYQVKPVNGPVPFRVGTRDFVSGYFLGAIGKVAIYNYALSDAQILAHYQAMK